MIRARENFRKAVAAKSRNIRDQRVEGDGGQSPIDRLIAFRIERAMKLLKDPSLNVSEVAARCGFEDSNYFSRRFRVATGRSPGQFRKNA